MSFSWGAFLFVLYNGIFRDYLFVILPDKEKDVSFVGPFLFVLRNEIFRVYFVILPDTEKDVLFAGRISFRSPYPNIPRVFCDSPDK